MNNFEVKEDNMEKKSILSHVKNRIETNEVMIQDDNKNYYENLKKTIILRTEMEIKSQIEIAKALFEIKQKQLFLYDGYKSFSMFLKDYNKGRTQAYRYIAVVEGIQNGLIKEEEVVEAGFKSAQKKILSASIKTEKTQFLLSFSLNHIENSEKRKWMIDHKHKIESYILTQINHHFSEFEKLIDQSKF